MKISQDRARAALKRVTELETQRRMERAAYGRAYPGGTHLGDWTIEKDWFWGTLNTAQILKHPLVVKVEGATLKFYALPTE